MVKEETYLLIDATDTIVGSHQWDGVKYDAKKSPSGWQAPPGIRAVKHSEAYGVGDKWENNKVRRVNEPKSEEVVEVIAPATGEPVVIS